MKFSEIFNLGDCEEEDWFDPILSVDTKLFIDPFLIYDSEQGLFSGSHAEVIRFFNSQFKQLAKTAGKRDSNIWKKAEAELVFPEVEELCLGYTGAGTGGAGSGPLLGKILAEAIWEAIEAGITEIRHFEEVAIIREGIGSDRISDITGCLLRWRLAAYTEAICANKNIPVSERNYVNGIFNADQCRWASLSTRVPVNVYNQKGILLCPKRYLRNLPTMDATDFWEYCCNCENERLRARYGDDVSRNVSKHEIVTFAREHPSIRERYVNFREDQGSVPYDFAADPKGVYRWYDETKEFCTSHPTKITFDSELSFANFVKTLTITFRHYVEQSYGWKLLWNDNKTPRAEESCQNLFLGIVKHYCKANDVDISREPDIGRGPVDFKMSTGFERRALIELKKANNSRFWNGLTKQLPAYQSAEEVRCGVFLVIAFNDKDLKKVAEIESVVQDLNRQIPYQIQCVVVDASRDKSSASKL